jgi:hypothetical protein
VRFGLSYLVILPHTRTENARRKEEAMKLKTLVMSLALAAATGATIACFGLFSKDKPEPIQPTLEESCEGLEGEARKSSVKP